jgi:hypothetical protein
MATQPFYAFDSNSATQFNLDGVKGAKDVDNPGLRIVRHCCSRPHIFEQHPTGRDARMLIQRAWCRTARISEGASHVALHFSCAKNHVILAQE